MLFCMHKALAEKPLACQSAIAQQIVGKKKLTQVSEMLESIGKTDDAISAMSKSFKSVSEISWKVKAGFKIDKDDVDKYKSSVEEYVKSAKEAVESKGYTVSIATRLLLGNNSKVGKENNEFYAGLDSKLNFNCHIKDTPVYLWKTALSLYCLLHIVNRVRIIFFYLSYRILYNSSIYQLYLPWNSHHT